MSISANRAVSHHQRVVARWRQANPRSERADGWDENAFHIYFVVEPDKHNDWATRLVRLYGDHLNGNGSWMLQEFHDEHLVPQIRAIMMAAEVAEIEAEDAGEDAAKAAEADKRRAEKTAKKSKA